MSEKNGKAVEPADAGERNMLTRAKAFKLMTWLSTQRDRLQNERPTWEQVAVQAAKALEFPVSRGNVAGCLADLEITWSPKRTGRSSGGGKVLAALRERVESLAARIDQLEGRAADLERRLAGEMAGRKLAENRLAALENEVAPFAVAGTVKPRA